MLTVEIYPVGVRFTFHIGNKVYYTGGSGGILYLPTI